MFAGGCAAGDAPVGPARKARSPTVIQEWDIEYTFSQRTAPLGDGSKDRD